MRWVEAASAFALPLVFWHDWYQASGHITWELRIAALALVSYILLQGALYWHLKIRSCDQRRPLPGNFHVLFGALQWSNLLAIGAMLAALLFGLAGSASRADLAWASGLLAFAVLEQINYYHYQLMYDTRAAIAGLRRNGRLRKAALGCDIARSRAARR